MPFPPPPPPPPGPPPPPAFNPPPPVAKGGKSGSGDQRGQLLADIRKGTGLKKAVTNDRSAPAIEGAGKNNARSGNSGGGPVALGGLFAGGMPVLKPAGGKALMPPTFKQNNTSKEENDVNKSINNKTNNNNNNKPAMGVRAGYGTVGPGFLREALKAQAPQPPPSNMKPNQMVKTGPPSLPNKPPGKFNNMNNKPTMKPPPPPKSPAILQQQQQPPALPSKPPSFRRHQSFNENDVRSGSIHKVRPKNEASSPDAHPVLRQPSFKNVSTPNLAVNGFNGKGPPPLPPSRDPNSATQQQFQQYNTLPNKLGPAPPPPNRTTPYQPKPPSNRPPPPPPISNNFKAPPTSPPPPPPHRINPPTTPPSSVQAIKFNPTLPPPPPVRNSSARNSISSVGNISDDSLESRFYHLFASINSLPAPDTFTNFPKTYASKNIQNKVNRAPPIPQSNSNTHIQIGQKMWSNPTSEC